VTRQEQLWAPWRLAFVSGEAAAQADKPALDLLPGADPDCFLCRYVADTNDRENLAIERSELSIVVVNRYPYNNGHLLVAPRLHKGQPDELTDHEQLDLQKLIAKYVGVLQSTLKAEGFNVGLNLGRVAGAGLPGHLHWHIVPRWSGDTNFMPALCGVKVMPQSLEALWEVLREANAAAGESR
jgi:ATP adenylyltransferase